MKIWHNLEVNEATIDRVGAQHVAAVCGILKDTISNQELLYRCLKSMVDSMTFNVGYSHVEIIHHLMAANDLPKSTRTRLRQYIRMSSSGLGGKPIDLEPIPRGVARNAILMILADDGAVDNIADSIEAAAYNKLGSIRSFIIALTGLTSAIRTIIKDAVIMVLAFAADEMYTSNFINEIQKEVSHGQV